MQKGVHLGDALTSTTGAIVLKVNFEGHELAVLEGAKATLQGKDCIVQIENFGGAFDAFFSGLGYRKLTSIGPDAFFTNADGIVPLAIHETAVAGSEAGPERMDTPPHHNPRAAACGC